MAPSPLGSQAQTVRHRYGFLSRAAEHEIVDFHPVCILSVCIHRRL
jgi:hypothetical protein